MTILIILCLALAVVSLISGVSNFMRHQVVTGWVMMVFAGGMAAVPFVLVLETVR